MAVPRLVVFDLDYTLWPFWVDTHVTPPFRLGANNVIFDKSNTMVLCYPDVPQMLDNLKRSGFKLAVASRTWCAKEAEDLIQLFGWNKFFDYKEIYPGSKKQHFQNFARNSGLGYKDMLFFDDEQRNITDVSTLGVTCIHTPNGMSFSVLKKGMDSFKAK